MQAPTCDPGQATGGVNTEATGARTPRYFLLGAFVELKTHSSGSPECDATPLIEEGKRGISVGWSGAREISASAELLQTPSPMKQTSVIELASGLENIGHQQEAGPDFPTVTWTSPHRQSLLMPSPVPHFPQTHWPQVRAHTEVAILTEKGLFVRA